MTFSFLKDIGNYESRKVGRDEIRGFVVSTAFTSDEGFETAIGDANGFHPVERYSSKEDAIGGHKKWCAGIESGMTSIVELGLSEIGSKAEPVDLVPQN